MDAVTQNSMVPKAENLPQSAPAHQALSGGISTEDLKLPTLLLVQGNSKIVKSGMAQGGDVFDTLENKVLASDIKACEIIPLYMNKVWQTYEINGAKQQYLNTVPFGPTNANWRYVETTPEGKNLKHSLVIRWFVLLASQLDAGDAMPYCISFKGVSNDAGKKLATLVTKGTMLKLPVFGRSYMLKTVDKTTDNGVFKAYDVSPGSIAKKEWCEAAAFWNGVLGTQKAVVEDDDAE